MCESSARLVEVMEQPPVTSMSSSTLSWSQLLDLVGLKLDLEELLGCSVDVATEDTLHWTIREQVLAEARPL